MLELRNVTKRYGSHPALREVSFTAPKGQIVGLLGVNGAGKTTALNVLTGCMPPTEGQVLVDGMDMMAQPHACKRLIGYLPEKPPLYDEMTVREYLTFAARLREVKDSAIPAHVDDIMRLCGLTGRDSQRAGSLSKGYRQRLGFAQALCGDPPVLVLDEPTVGLDPRQVAEIRDLMRELGKTHTVLFSTHLLSEAQQLCQRVIILHHGRVIREMDMDAIGAEASLRLRITVDAPPARTVPALKSLSCVRRVKTHPSRQEQVTEATLECAEVAPGEADAYSQLFHLLCALDAPLRLLVPEGDTLEQVFLKATAEE